MERTAARGTDYLVLDIAGDQLDRVLAVRTIQVDVNTARSVHFRAHRRASIRHFPFATSLEPAQSGTAGDYSLIQENFRPQTGVASYKSVGWPLDRRGPA